MINLKSPLLLDKLHIRQQFDCGEEALNIFLKEYALQNSKNNASRTYVCSTKNDNIVSGYYTLTYGAIRHQEATEKVKKNMPHYPIPVMILARLAIDKKYQKLGLGKEILKDALLRTLQASEIAGLKAIIAHAKNSDSISFYKKYGFEQSKFDEKHLMLSIQDIFCSLDIENKS